VRFNLSGQPRAIDPHARTKQMLCFKQLTTPSKWRSLGS
jgi:hypothetical protein